MSADLPTLADLALLRQEVYRALALVLLPPEPGRRDKLIALVREIQAAEPTLATFAFFVPLRRMLDAARDAPAAAVAAEHARLFGHGVPDGARCPPYEARYLGGARPDEAAGFVIAQLEHVHRRFGLRVAPSGTRRPDHVAVELEVMAFLCAHEGAAWMRASLDDGIHLLGEEHAFLQLHLGAWAGPFAADLRASARDPLFTATADALDAFVRHDRDLIATLARETERAA